jgi:hypothetical protein
MNSFHAQLVSVADMKALLNESARPGRGIEGMSLTYRRTNLLAEGTKDDLAAA